MNMYSLPRRKHLSVDRRHQTHAPLPICLTGEIGMILPSFFPTLASFYVSACTCRGVGGQCKFGQEATTARLVCEGMMIDPCRSMGLQGQSAQNGGRGNRGLRIRYQLLVLPGAALAAIHAPGKRLLLCQFYPRRLT